MRDIECCTAKRFPSKIVKGKRNATRLFPMIQILNMVSKLGTITLFLVSSSIA